jgi:hypothetical protein
MQRKKPGVDVIKDVLDFMLKARPDSPFVQSLARQYEERGHLSKKQLEGLRQKALNVHGIAEHKLATMEAIIMKRPTRERSKPIVAAPLFVKDDQTGMLLLSILELYPGHKRILFLKAKYDNNEVISAAEQSELKKLAKLLLG